MARWVGRESPTPCPRCGRRSQLPLGKKQQHEPARQRQPGACAPRGEQHPCQQGAGGHGQERKAIHAGHRGNLPHAGSLHGVPQKVPRKSRDQIGSSQFHRHPKKRAESQRPSRGAARRPSHREAEPAKERRVNDDEENQYHHGQRRRQVPVKFHDGHEPIAASGEKNGATHIPQQKCAFQPLFTRQCREHGEASDPHQTGQMDFGKASHQQEAAQHASSPREDMLTQRGRGRLLKSWFDSRGGMRCRF